MQVTGYALREAIRRWELVRDTAYSQFEDTLTAFPNESKPLPATVAEIITKAEGAIAALQSAQQRYNLIVLINAGGQEMTLCEGVKRLGGAGRYEKLWRGAAGGGKKERYYHHDPLTRKSDEIHAVRTISADACMNLAKAAARFASELRSAIAVGNATRMSLDTLKVDPRLLEM